MNSNTLNITIEVDDKGTPKIKKLGKEMETASGKGEKGFKRTNKSLGDFNGTISGTTKLVRTLAGAWATLKLLQLAKVTLDLADQWTLLDNKLKLVTQSERELASVQQGLYDLSLRSHAAYSTSVDLYSRFARATETFGTSQKELLRITETLNKATLISGSTQQEAAASLLQLSQGMASGVLRGEEFNSVTENSSRIAKILADHLRVDIGELRNMATEGKITSRIMLEAFTGAAAGIDEEFSKMQVTVSQSMTDLSTVWASVIHDANETSGATNDIATSIQELADTIDENREGIISLFVGMIDVAGKTVSAVGLVGKSIEGLHALALMAKFGDRWKEEWAKINATGTEKLQNKLIDLRSQLDAVGSSYARGGLTASGYANAEARLQQEIFKTIVELDELLGFQDEVKTSTESMAGAVDGATLSWQQLAQAQMAGHQVGSTDMFMGQGAADDRAEDTIKEQEKITAAVQILAAKQAEAYRDMYDDMELSAEEDFVHREGLLKKRKESYLKVLVEENKDHEDAIQNSILIERWHNAEIEDLEDERLLKTGDFFDGVKLYLQESENNFKSWAERSYELTVGLTDGMEATLGDWLSNVLLGKFDNMGDAWDALWTGMLQTVVDTVAQMAVEFAVDTAVSAFFHSGTWGLAADEYRAVLQRGEIVVPRAESDQIRDNMGPQSGFEGLVGLTADAKEAASTASPAGLSEYGRVGAGVGTVAGHIAAGATGITTPGAKTAGRAIGAKIGGFLAEEAADALGVRSMEGIRDALGSGLIDETEAHAFAQAAKQADPEFGKNSLTGLLDTLNAVDAKVAMAIDTIMAPIEDAFSAMAMGDIEGHEAEARESVDSIDADPYGLGRGEGGDHGSGVEGTGTDMNNPGSDMGELGDADEAFARDGGVFHGDVTGYPATLHGIEAVVPLPNGRSIPVELQGADKKGAETVALIEEIRALRTDIRAGNYQLAKNTGATGRILKRWEQGGMPENRVMVQ